MSQRLFYFFLFIITFSYIELSQADPASLKPFPPFRIVGNIYYVGDQYQADYLIVTSQGNILINSGFKENVPLIKASIEKLGFKYSDTKILLINHAHPDHAGGSNLIKKETGANYRVMAEDIPVIESGGKTDFRYGNDPAMLYQPTKVDQVLHDGDQVKLGNTVLVAHFTAGHTKGGTTWTMQAVENGKKYNVIIVDSLYVNPGYKLVHNKSYPTIAQDYKHTFQVLKSLPCDIFLGAHGGYFDLEKKYALINKRKTNPFIDPKGYQNLITLKEQDFYTELHKQEAMNMSVRE